MSTQNQISVLRCLMNLANSSNPTSPLAFLSNSLIRLGASMLNLLASFPISVTCSVPDLSLSMRLNRANSVSRLPYETFLERLVCGLLEPLMTTSTFRLGLGLGLGGMGTCFFGNNESHNFLSAYTVAPPFAAVKNESFSKFGRKPCQ